MFRCGLDNGAARMKGGIEIAVAFSRMKNWKKTLLLGGMKKNVHLPYRGKIRTRKTI